MLQLSSLAKYINNNTEWLRVGVRGYVIDCRHSALISINHYQKMFCVVIIYVFTVLFTCFQVLVIMHFDSCIDGNGLIMCVKYFIEGCTDYDELS